MRPIPLSKKQRIALFHGWPKRYLPICLCNANTASPRDAVNKKKNMALVTGIATIYLGALTSKIMHLSKQRQQPGVSLTIPVDKRLKHHAIDLIY